MKKQLFLAMLACTVVSGCGNGENIGETQETVREMQVKEMELPEDKGLTENDDSKDGKEDTNRTYLTAEEYLDSVYNTTNIIDDIMVKLESDYHMTSQNGYSGSADVLVVEELLENGESKKSEFYLNGDRFTKKIILSEESDGERVLVFVLDGQEAELDEETVVAELTQAIAHAVDGIYRELDYATVPAADMELFEMHYLTAQVWDENGYSANSIEPAYCSLGTDCSYEASGAIWFGEDESSILPFETLYNDDTGCYTVTADGYRHIVGTFYDSDYMNAKDMATDIVNHMALFYNEYMTPTIPLAVEKEVPKKESDRTVRSTADFCILMTEYAKETNVNMAGPTYGDVDFYASMVGLSLDGFDNYLSYRVKGSTNIKVLDREFEVVYEPDTCNVVAIPNNVYGEERDKYRENPLLTIDEKDFETREDMASYAWGVLSMKA